MYVLLRKGDRLPSVAALQILLNRHIVNGKSIPVNGTFDAVTYAAVRNFQTRYRLKVDGVAGKNTWGALLEGTGLVIHNAADVSDNPRKELYEDGGRPSTAAAMSNGVGHLVEQIVSHVSPGSVLILRMHGHGGPGGMGVSSGNRAWRAKNRVPIDTTAMVDAFAGISYLNVLMLAPELERLRPVFTRFGSAELHGCNTGHGWEGLLLLTQLAKIWGVPVSAGTGNQYSGASAGAFEGEVTTCFPGGGELAGWAASVAEAGMSHA